MSYNTNKTHKEYIEKLIELLNDSRADNRDEWKDISFIINNELGDDGLELFQQFSSKSSKYDSIKDDKWYLNLRKSDSGLFIGSLIKFVKEDNLEGYEALRKEYINTNSIKATFTLLEKDIAEYVINKLLNNNFVNTMPKPGMDFYYFNGNVWERDKGTRNLLKIIYDDLINEYEQYIIKITKEAEKLKEKEKEIHLKTAVNAQKLVKKMKGKLCYINSIIEWISVLTYNPMFFDIIDENPDLIAFTNGTYDLSSKTFRKSRKEDYITKTVGYDFPEPDKDYGHKKDIENFLRQVFPDEEVRNFVVQTQAQALCGRKNTDKVYTHTGRGGNGKSILIEILTNVFGNYFVNIPAAMLTKANDKGHNDPDPYMAKLKGARYAMSNEPKDGATFNDALIKNLGSQDPLEYRMLYSNDVLPLRLQLKMNIYCNNKLKFNGQDKGVGRRMCVIDYISKFEQKPDETNNIYLIDVHLTDKVKNWKQDYMNMLIKLYKIDYTFTPPPSVVNASEIYVNENNDIYNFIKNSYTKTGKNEDFILLKEIKMEYQMKREYDQTKLKTLKESIEKELNTNFIENKKIKGKNYTNVITGWKLIKDDSDDDIGVLD